MFKHDAVKFIIHYLRLKLVLWEWLRMSVSLEQTARALEQCVAVLMMMYNHSLFICLLGREIIDITGKENGIDIVMPERTYHLIADTAEDAR